MEQCVDLQCQHHCNIQFTTLDSTTISSCRHSVDQWCVLATQQLVSTTGAGHQQQHSAQCDSSCWHQWYRKFWSVDSECEKHRCCCGRQQVVCVAWTCWQYFQQSRLADFCLHPNNCESLCSGLCRIW